MSERTEYIRERERKWYAANRASILERKRKWRAANKQSVSRSNKSHYENNPEFHKERRQARKQDPEKWRKYGRDRYATKREELIEYGKRWREKNRDKYKRAYQNSRIKSKYGITLEQYEEMSKMQGGKCLACGIVPSGKAHASRLHLDHCHQTGRLRGMLCYQCNLALGLVKDSVERLISLAAYLEKNK